MWSFMGFLFKSEPWRASPANPARRSAFDWFSGRARGSTFGRHPPLLLDGVGNCPDTAILDGFDKGCVIEGILLAVGFRPIGQCLVQNGGFAAVTGNERRFAAP